jgi:glycosyltransferase involved in cell wall biosynthesis
MKVLCFVHGYPPDHNAGAEWMLHSINKFLISRGHEVKVMTKGNVLVSQQNGRKIHTKLDSGHTFEGVDVSRVGVAMYGPLFRWADVVITHLDQAGKAMNLCRGYEKPLVHLMHNTHHNDVLYRINPQNNYVVYNAEWNKKASKYINKSYVLYPPVNYEDYEVKVRGKNITLINCFEPKGGNFLVSLAKELPDYNFLGVLGAYGDQVIGKSKNLKYEDNTPDIKKVYAKSRIVLMPSSYESWGRVAVEAMSSGIPVIAHPTPGLKESLGDAGLFAHRDHIGDWVKIIKELDDPKYYKEVSEKCKARAKELTEISDKQLDKFNAFLENIKRIGYV